MLAAALLLGGAAYAQTYTVKVNVISTPAAQSYMASVGASQTTMADAFVRTNLLFQSVAGQWWGRAECGPRWTCDERAAGP